MGKKWAETIGIFEIKKFFLGEDLDIKQKETQIGTP